MFVSYDYENDRQYKNMLLARSKNTEFDFYINDQSVDVSVDANDDAAIKRVISASINKATYFLCPVGKSTYKSKWVAWEIGKAVELKKRLVGVKIEKDNSTPSALLNQGATWALSFTFDSITKALDQAVLLTPEWNRRALACRRARLIRHVGLRKFDMGMWTMRQACSGTMVLATWLLFGGATLSTLDARPQASAEARPAPMELRKYVERLTGPSPADCGLRPLVRPFVTASAEELQRSVSCGLGAAKSRKPFWTFNQVQGIDSLLFYGLLGTTEGTIFRFSYDSAPCGGPRCAGSFTIERCDSAVVLSRGGRADFGCQR